MMSPTINIKGLSLQFTGSDSPLFSDVNLQLQGGQWTCLLGPSGCGKTTLLKLLADLLENVSCQGQVEMSDGLPLHGRIAYMAQQDLLLPWLNVLDNACLSEKFGPKIKGKDQQTSMTLELKAIELLKQVGLGKVLYQRPQALSGGMRQRVALVRTLLQNKPVVLMDEPFSALDAVTRYQLQSLSATMLKGKTVLFITHDPQEALRLANHLFMMHSSPIRLQSLPLPDDLPPRSLSATLAQYQQQIINELEANYVNADHA